MESANETKDKIILLAQKKMGEVGIKSVSIDDICRELGMSKKTFYVYFAAKDDLIAAILASHYEEVRQGMQTFIDSQKTMWDAIRFGLQKMAQMPDVRRLPPFIYDLNKYYPTLAKDYNARIFQLNKQMMQRVVERCVDEGLFRSELDVQMAAFMLARLHDNMVQSGMKHAEGDIPLHKISDFTLDVVLRGLFSQQGLTRYEELLKQVRKK